MKAICPITGIPFRTYDSLRLPVVVNHPVFSIPYEGLLIALEDIAKQEEETIALWNKDTIAQQRAVKEAAKITELTSSVNEAINEHNWKNPAFRLYQSKHLIMLALMHDVKLLVVDKGYAARPKPEIIDAHFWYAAELFCWVNTLANPQLIDGIPKYRINRDTEDMKNFKDYLEAVDAVKTSIGNKYRSASTEAKLFAWEQAIAILGRRRETLKVKLSDGRNFIAAKWALTITNAPSDIWDFWYAILSSSSTKITFEGVKLESKDKDGKITSHWETVTAGDLRELRDWLDDNLIGPKGESKEYHRDDTEYYFIARHTVLEIVRQHIAILEQGTSSYKIVNAAMGDDILNANDDTLNTKAINAGLDAKPTFEMFTGKVELIRAMALWRHTTKQKLLDLTIPKESGDKEKKEVSFEIL